MSETKTVVKTAKPAKDAAKPRPAIYLREGAAFKALADKLKVRPKDLLDRLIARGYAIGSNDVIDEPLAAQLSKDLNVPIEIVPVEREIRIMAESRKADLVTRAPVVTIMGHVDHGKTTLLDAIRTSNLVDKESGGITQHIGAYRVTHGKRFITFIDTPGHEAFTQLRARGAKLTDIVVLVIAADEGIMPQTRESINHAKAGRVPMIVAINKTDKPEANPDKIKRELQKDGLLVEEWGGDVIAVEVSAREKKGIKELLEMILLMADVLDLKANPKVPAQGVVLEARMDGKKGPLATVIIQHGTLSVGNAFIAGTTFGRVRALADDAGRLIKTAGPSIPVEILGFSEVPQAGDFFQAIENADEAKAIVDYRLSRGGKSDAPKGPAVTLDDMFKKLEQGESKELALVVKADVQGTVEVLKALLPTFGTPQVKIKIIHAATGAINESDLLLASTTGAVIIGQNVKAGAGIEEQATKQGVEIRTYKIIYKLTDEIKKAVTGMLEPVIKETYLGRAQVRKVFHIPKVGTIAGSYVQDGRITRNAEVRVLRGKEVVHRGKLSSLKHIKENVNEIKSGHECGIGLANFKDVQEGDLIEAFITEKVVPR
ncbi:MAG: translation initiation factor IF-2 [Candidatus Aminicenantes bacterium]|nr:translation initiation factor IF-2 [Candidatus Aminicenantes bacterium]